MWLEAIIVTGFRSFRDRTEVKFDRGHTAIIGRNGSGKSNLLSALAFVLQAPRGQRFLETFYNGGKNLPHLQVCVEVIINDEDERLTDDVVVRDHGDDPRKIVIKRFLGQKKDNFFIGRKAATSKEVLEFLSSAGVLSSNPYHFVRQGEINSLAEANPAKRLKLLEDFAGTTVHKEKRVMSLKLQSHTEREISEIKIQLEELTKDMENLNFEVEELKMFQKLDKKCRALQYVLLKRDQRKLEPKLSELVKNRAEHCQEDEIERKQKRIEETESRFKASLKAIAASESSENEVTSNLDEFRKDYDSLVTSKTKNDEDIQDLMKKIEEEELKQKNALDDLVFVKEEYDDTLKMLEKEERKLAGKRMKEENCRTELARRQKRLDLIHGRGGMKAAFDNEEDFMAWLLEEKQSVAKQVADQTELISTLEEELSQKKLSREKLLANIDRYGAEKVELFEVESSLTRDRENIGRTCEQLKLERGQLIRETINLSQKVNSLVESQANAENRLARSQGMKNVIAGVKSVEKILQYLRDEKDRGLGEDVLKELRLKGTEEEFLDQMRHEGLTDEFISQLRRKGVSFEVLNVLKRRLDEDSILEGIHGFVADNFTCTEHLFTAISATVGRQLLFLIVENPKVVQDVLKLQKTLRLSGEIVFMPITLIRPYSNLEYPDPEQNKNCKPLIDLIEYDVKFDKIMRFVFGKLVVVKSMKDFSRTFPSTPPTDSAPREVNGRRNLTFVTLDGQQSTGKGVLTGGYYPSKTSRLMLYTEYKTAKMQTANAERQLLTKTATLRALDMELEKNLRSFQQIQTKLEQNSSNRSKLMLEVQKMTSEARVLQDQYTNLESGVRAQRIQLVEMEEKLSSLKALSASGGGTPQNESQELEELVNEIREWKSLAQKFSHESNVSEVKKNALKNSLEIRLEPKLRELEIASSPSSVDKAKDRLRSCLDRKPALASELTRVEVDIETANKSLEDLISGRKTLTKNSEKLFEEKETLKRDYEEFMTRKASLDRKEREIRAKIEEIATKISQQDSLPTDWQKYETYSDKDCQTMISNAKERLNSLGLVNKAAGEQYEDALKKRDNFQTRLDDIERDHIATEELLAIINLKKREKLELTRLQVSKYFSEIFALLVPNGRGRLHFEMSQSRSPPPTPDRSGDTSPSSNSTDSSSLNGEEEKAIGLSILASFGSTVEMADMQTLSGGQKSIVALAFIFAIQKCDPAPFYIFDEVDAALDSGARSRVAQWMEMSKKTNGTQFITTTHRKELMEKADRFIGVKYANTVSISSEVSKEDAVEFIADT